MALLKAEIPVGMTRILALIVILLAVVATSGAVTAVDNAQVGNGIEMEPDSILIEVTVDETGHAEWRVEYRIRLDDESDREAFQDLRDDIEADPSAFEDPYRERMQRAATAAANATDRDMAIEEVHISAETRDLPEEHGIVRYEFHWSHFAHLEGDQVEIGDAVEGLFLDERTVLMIRWPDGWVASEISPQPTEERESAAIWRGPVDFGGGEPRVSVSEPGVIPVGAGIALLLLVALAGVGGLVWVGVRRSGVLGGMKPDGSEAAQPAVDIDDELLSNEEQVIRLIEHHGGRMKQRDVMEELDWTAAKTSQVSQDLRDSGRLEGFRLGRENVLKLPDSEDDPPT